MVKKVSSLVLVFVLITSISCSDDFLYPDPQSFFAPENVYVDEDGFRALVVTMSKDIKSEHYGDQSAMGNEHALSDLAVPGARTDRAVKDFPQNLTPAGDGGVMEFSRLFDNAYEAIKSTNILVSRVDDVEWDQEEVRNQLLAEAYFYRAYWYYRLVNTYGNVPFIGEEITEPRVDFYTHSRWAILDKIQEDLEWAVDWLPESANPGQATRGAGNHLLTKVYLANLEFDQAISTANHVIDGPYALMTERFGIDADDSEKNVIWDLHRPDNVNNTSNTETIFAVVDRFGDPAGAKSSGGLSLARAYNPQWHEPDVTDSQGERGMVQEGPQYNLLSRGNGYYRPTVFYLYENWDRENDLRRSDANWIEWYEILYNNPSSVDYGKPVDRANFAVPIDTFQKSYSIPHYKTYQQEQDPAVRPTGGHGDMYIFRLAETHLLRAEAHFWNGNYAQASNDLNMVRERAGARPISSDEVDIDFIFDERARELFIESPRHSEMVRVSYIMAGDNRNGYSLESFSQNNWFYDRTMSRNSFFQINLTWGSQSYRLAPHNVLYPVPETVITENTQGVINQNEGYTGTERNEPPLESID